MSKPISETDGSSGQPPANEKLDGTKLKTSTVRTNPIVERKNQPSESGHSKSPSESQEHQRTRLSSRRILFYRITAAFTRSLFAIVVVVFAVAITWYFLFAAKDKKIVDKTDRERPVASTFDEVMQSDDPAELLKYSAKLDENFMYQPLPVVVARLREKIQVGRRLESLHADESSYIVGLQTQLDCLTVREILNVKNSLNDEAGHQELIETANRLIDHENVNIAQKAQLALSLPAMHAYIKDNSDENYEKVEALVLSSVKNQINDMGAVVGLKPVFELIEQSQHADHISRFRLVVGNLLKSSQLPEVWAIGAELHDEMLLGDIDYPELSRQILNDDKAALDRLDKSVKAVAASDTASAIPLSKLISLIENLEQIGMAEQEAEYIGLLRQANKDGQNLKNKELIENAFIDYEKRKGLAGTEFDLTINDASVDMATTKNKFVVLVFYSSFNSESFSCLERLNDLSYFRKQGVEFVAVCADKETNQTAQSQIASAFSECIILARPMATSYFEQCPVAKVPYILLLDREHRVVATNVDVDRLRLQLEQLTIN